MRASISSVLAAAAFLTLAPVLAAQQAELPCRSYATFERNGSTTQLIGLAIGDVPAGSNVRLICSGSACPFSARSFTMKNDVKTLALTDMFSDPDLKPGTVIQIRVTKPGWIGKSFTYEILAATDPRVTSECLAADQSSTVACAAKEDR